jgi:hypothetical protein
MVPNMHINVLKLVNIHNEPHFSASNVTIFRDVKLCHMVICRDVKLCHVAIFRDVKLGHVVIFRDAKLCRAAMFRDVKLTLFSYIPEDGNMAGRNMSKFTAHTN